MLFSRIREQTHCAELCTTARPHNKLFLPTTWWLLIVSWCSRWAPKKVTIRWQNPLIHLATENKAEDNPAVIPWKDCDIRAEFFLQNAAATICGHNATSIRSLARLQWYNAVHPVGNFKIKAFSQILIGFSASNLYYRTSCIRIGYGMYVPFILRFSTYCDSYSYSITQLNSRSRGIELCPMHPSTFCMFGELRTQKCT